MGNGDGTFQPAFFVFIGSYLDGIAAADFRSSGIIDLAVVDNGSGNIAILTRKGNDTFWPPQFTSVGSYTAELAADFDGDGRTDLTVTNSFSDEVVILINNTTPASRGAPCHQRAAL